MKKLFKLAVIAVAVVSFASCSGNKTGENNGDSTSTDSSAVTTDSASTGTTVDTAATTDSATTPATGDTTTAQKPQ